MVTYSVINFESRWYDLYEKFVNRNFGKGAYQSSQDYLNWLYFDNPYGKGYADFLIVVVNHHEVVGCIHKLRFELFDNIKKQQFSGVSIHNLMIDIKHRNGVGFLLIREILKKEKTFVVPGVIGDLSEAYKKLGSRKIISYWGYKVFLPKMLKFIGRLVGKKISKVDIFNSINNLNIENIEVKCHFDHKLINDLNGYFPAIKLDQDYVKWRFFYGDNLRTVVLSEVDTGSFLLMVVGKRKGMPVSRIIFTAFSDKTSGINLTNSVIKLSADLGCVMVLVTSSDSLFGPIAKKLKINRRTIAPDTYLYNKLYEFEDFSIWPLISDLGFEEAFGGES